MRQLAPRRVLEGSAWLLAIAAVVGLWWYPDLISRLRSAGSLYAEVDRDCDLGAGPCEVAFPDGVSVRLGASPQPTNAQEPVQLRVTVDGESTPVAVEIQGAEMAMGFLRLPLEPDDGGWSVSAALPVCTTARMVWKADVVLDDRVAGFFLVSTR